MAGWSAVAPPLHGRIYIMFGPVVTTEAHLAYAGSRTHNTAELSSIVARFTFMHFLRFQVRCQYLLGHNPITDKRPPRSRMSTPFIANSVKATDHHAAHLQSCAGSRKNECVHHAASLGTFGLVSNQNISLPHVGHTLHLTPIRASLLVTTLVMSWKNCAVLEERVYLPRKARSEVGVLFHAASLCDLPRHHLCFLDLLLFCCLALSMQTPFCSGKQCFPIKATDTSTRSSSHTSRDPGE